MGKRRGRRTRRREKENQSLRKSECPASEPEPGSNRKCTFSVKNPVMEMLLDLGSCDFVLSRLRTDGRRTPSSRLNFQSISRPIDPLQLPAATLDHTIAPTPRYLSTVLCARLAKSLDVAVPSQTAHGDPSRALVALGLVLVLTPVVQPVSSPSRFSLVFCARYVSLMQGPAFFVRLCLARNLLVNIPSTSSSPTAFLLHS